MTMTKAEEMVIILAIKNMIHLDGDYGPRCDYLHQVIDDDWETKLKKVFKELKDNDD